MLEKDTVSNHDTGAATLPLLAACGALVCGTSREAPNLQQVVEVEGGGDRTQEAELAVGQTWARSRKNARALQRV